MALPNVFTSGDVFTAANANLLRSNQYNQTVSTKTANYVLVAGDVGTRVLMNAAGSTTITVNTSLFVAGDTLEIANIGAGVCTITSGTCTVTSSATLALAQYASGTLFFTSASAAIFIASAVTAPAGALTLINAGSFSAAASASLPTNSFSATYKNYKVIYQLSAVSGANALRIRFRAAGSDNTASNYDFAEYGRQYGAATAIVNESTGADNLYLVNSISYSALSIDVLTPQATAQTIMFSSVNGNNTTADGAFQYNARFTATTSFDAMTLYVSAGTITGTFRVYGYGDS
jgi:hypothetical protein